MPKAARPPARYLWLLRHGKAASDAPWGGGDRERPLTARGRRDASALGHRLAAGEGVFGLEHVLMPDLVMCSAAVRTRQTADLVVTGMGGRLPIDSYRSLYGAETDTVVQYLRELDDAVKSLLLVGHNPTMYRLAWELLAGGDHDPSEADVDDSVDDSVEGDDRITLRNHGFPTCALAVVILAVESWEDVVDGCGALAGVSKPPY